METPELELTFIPAPRDVPVKTSDSVSETEQIRREFTRALQNCGLRVPNEAYDLGVHLIKLTPTIGPILGTAVGAWLHARYGRKVRLKVGDIEAEAQTREEVEKLLARAMEIQQRNQPPKVIP